MQFYHNGSKRQHCCHINMTYSQVCLTRSQTIFKKIIFPLWIRNRLISAGYDLVQQRHTKKSLYCIVTNDKIKIIKLTPGFSVWPLWDNKTGFIFMIYHFNIRGNTINNYHSIQISDQSSRLHDHSGNMHIFIQLLKSIVVFRIKHSVTRNNILASIFMFYPIVQLGNINEPTTKIYKFCAKRFLLFSIQMPCHDFSIWGVKFR